MAFQALTDYAVPHPMTWPQTLNPKPSTLTRIPPFELCQVRVLATELLHLASRPQAKIRV